MKFKKKHSLLSLIISVALVMNSSISVMAETEIPIEYSETELNLSPEGGQNTEDIPGTQTEQQEGTTPGAGVSPEETGGSEPTNQEQPNTPTGSESESLTQSDQESDVTDKEEVSESEESDEEKSDEEESEEETDEEDEEEEGVTELTYEDESVVIVVSAEEEGIIPEDAELSVTPIIKKEITAAMSAEEQAQQAAINQQYDFTEEMLQKDSEDNETSMEGFLAYDICFLVDGAEFEPDGNVRVTMTFKTAAIPEDVSEDAQITVKHLNESSGAIFVENMSANVVATENAEVQRVELVTSSFSTYTVVWDENTPLAEQLKKYLEDAEDGAIVELPDDVEYDYADPELGTISITKNVTLDLKGHTITVSNMTGLHALFNISDTAFTLTDTGTDSEHSFSYTLGKVQGIDAVSQTPQTYTGGYITGASGNVFLVNNGTLNLDGGALYQNGTLALNGSTPIKAEGTSTVNMNKIKIVDNNAYKGGAIWLTDSSTVYIGSANENSVDDDVVLSGNNAQMRGGGVYADIASHVNLSSGYITNNTVLYTGQNPSEGGGGIRLDNTAGLTMTGGYITSNTSQNTGGGGIKAGYWYQGQGLNLTISGGYISGNTAGGTSGATRGEGAGLALYSDSHTYISGTVYITHNTLNATQDWGGGGVFVSRNGTLTIQNVLVTQNKAYGFGGGVAGCSTGHVITNGTYSAIFDNYATGQNRAGAASNKAEDRTYTDGNTVFLTNGYNDYFCCLDSAIDNQMLGGNWEQWTGSADGRVINAGESADVIYSSYLIGLNANPSAAAKDAAWSAAKVVIAYNSAYTHGGGILCNGYMSLGEEPTSWQVPDQISITAQKGVYDSEDNAIAHSDNTFEFVLMDENFTEVNSVTSVTKHGDATKGEFTLVIPFRLDDNAAVGTTMQKTYYILERDSNGMYNTDDTVYQIVLTGARRSGGTVIMLNSNGTGQRVTITYDTITEHHVYKGTLNDSGSFAPDQDSEITSKCGYTEGDTSHAKTLTLYENAADSFANTRKSITITGQKGVYEDIAGTTGSRAHTDNMFEFELLDSDLKQITTTYSTTSTTDNTKGLFTFGLDFTIPDDVAVDEPYSVTTYIREVTGTDTYQFDSTVYKVEISGEKKQTPISEEDSVITDNITDVKVTKGTISDNTFIEDVSNPNVPVSTDDSTGIYQISLNSDQGSLSDAFQNTYTIINISGSKTWFDNNNQDGKRPDSIKINLLADGDKIDSRTVTATADWQWSFTNLPKYANGQEIKYTITEDTVTGYTSTVIGYNVTNKHTPETVDISGSKTWDDNDDQDGKRPDSITINLLADGEKVADKTVTATADWQWSFTNLPKYANGQEIKYTITEDTVTGYTSTVIGYNVTNKHTPETVNISGSKTWDDNDDQDGKRPDSIKINLLADGDKIDSRTVTATADWQWSFTNLPKYANGQEIKYTITEDTVTDYTTIVSGYNVTNKHTPETVNISGSKTWDDNDDQDGKRPESIKINLLADGDKIDSRTVTATADWQWSFTNLPKYANGQEIKYTITEDTVTGYTSTVIGYNVTNKHTPETVNISGSKTWDDNDDQDGKRPDSIKINLLADGDKIDSRTVTATADWQWSFTNLPKYANGQEIKYTITEDTVTGYTATVIGYNVTNKHTPETVDISGSKTWDDTNNQDGKRPESITINLYADGKKVAEKNVTANDNWAWTFTNLPKYANGKEIIYTISEDAVSDYTTEVNGYNVTNSYTPGKTSVSVTKSWKDSNNADGIRPDSVTVKLLADGTDTGLTITLDASNNWTASFTDLDEYRDEGVEIVYTIEEESVRGYNTVITGDAETGFVVTNSHTPTPGNNTGSTTDFFSYLFIFVMSGLGLALIKRRYS